MATQDTATSPAVAELATEQVNLPRTALLGIVGTASARRALVRLSKGKTQTVRVGDRIARSTVAAINDDQLVLSRGGSTQILTMPKG